MSIQRLGLVLAKERQIKTLKVLAVVPDQAMDLILHVQAAGMPDSEIFELLCTIGVKRQFIKLYDQYELQDEQDFVGVHLYMGQSDFHPDHPMWRIDLPLAWMENHKHGVTNANDGVHE